MQVSLRLLAADLHYPKDLQIHTAASGLVGSLSARYLQIERSDGFSGIGEIRANITYLSKLPEAAVDPAIRDLGLIVSGSNALRVGSWSSTTQS